MVWFISWLGENLMCVKMEIKFFLVGPDSMSTFNLVSGNDRPKKSVLLATPSETLVKMGNE